MAIVVIGWMSSGNDIVQSPNQLHAVYTNVRRWMELIYFMTKNGCPTEPYILTLRLKSTLGKDKFDKEYMGLYTNGYMLTDPIYGQILYYCCLSNVFKLKLGHNPTKFSVIMKLATVNEIAEHGIRPVAVIPASRV
jgi:hypothetical protein